MIEHSGILLIDKPAGITSFGVVGRVRWVLSQKIGKKIKVGHTGTLDPFATGLMILVVGEYCKRAGEFSKLDKSYEATLVLGKTSSTGDPEGEITEVSDRRPSLQELEDTVQQFKGEIIQTPPIYSAIKIGGQRAYKLAREGKKVEMPTRTVKIYDIKVTDYAYPNVNIVCDVGSGTYIRTLGEDIGKMLGVGAYTTALRRTKVGSYSIENSQNLDDTKSFKLFNP